MANKKVSELDSLSNIQDDDLVEITKYMGTGLGDGGGDYKSYKMTWAHLKAFFKYDEIVTVDNIGDGTAQYIADRWTFISHWVNPYQAMTLSMTDGNGNVIFSVGNGETAGVIMRTNNESAEITRTYDFLFGEDYGRVYLFITKNLNIT